MQPEEILKIIDLIRSDLQRAEIRLAELTSAVADPSLLPLGLDGERLLAVRE